jgi:hypothetical protein
MSLSLASSSAIKAGDTFAVVLTVTSDNSLNTFAGTLVYPGDLVASVSTNDANSIATLWLTPPTQKDGSIVFAGFRPGGFDGARGQLFEVTFKASREGNAQLSLRDVQLLRIDGAGTCVRVNAQDLLFSIAPPQHPETFPHVSTTNPYEGVALGGMLLVLALLWFLYTRFFKRAK